uniref:HrPET-1 n=1 Tax=Halocynthia roretzi TaxID=7729 RepID=Q9Y1V8_HALRO|nr:HrPET-1 [Halocynthia roretzi]
MSSLASSSYAATSIMGDLSDSQSLNSSDGEENVDSSKIVTDRFGFTGGNQYTDPKLNQMSVEKIRFREQKWLSMLNSWDKWMAKRFPQVKNRCRKGIPSSLRGRAWQLLSGSKALYEQNPGKYEEYLKMQPDQNCVEDIEKDLHRQFPFHEMFVQKGGTGQQDLRDVLLAYSVYNREDGYCQAQAPIAAVLLMHMPAEQAFWCIVAMCEHYLQGYFSPGLEAIQVDGLVMQGLLRKVSGVAYKHLEKHQVSPVLYMTEWFMCVFSRTLSWPAVLRLWDMFFCEGIKVIFRCALVILRNTLGSSDKLKKMTGLYETMEALRKIDKDYIREDRLMFEIVNLKINERDLEHENKLQKIKWKKENKGQHPSTGVPRDGKRVYRYTPTYRKSEIGSRHNGKSKSQNISTISANSSFIMQQTLKAEKVSSRKASKLKTGKTGEHQAKSEEVVKESKVAEQVEQEAQSELSQDETKKQESDQKQFLTSEPVITSFSATSVNKNGNLKLASDSEVPVVPVSEEEPTKRSHENLKEEITVF